MSQEETIEILEELLNSVKSRGYKKTLTVLKTERLKKANLTTPFEQFVVKSVADAFEITEDDLIFSRYIRGENKYAIGFCVYYLYDNASLGEIHKKIFKHKNKTLLSKYRQIVFDMRATNVVDKKFISIKTELDKKIENFKKNN
jgi:hypothetical protein